MSGVVGVGKRHLLRAFEGGHRNGASSLRAACAPDEPRLRLPIVHETTYRNSLKGPIAIRQAFEMHLSEQWCKMIRMVRDDGPEMQILLSRPVHEMTYLKSIHRRAGL